jgi:hypothetical protein
MTMPRTELGLAFPFCPIRTEKELDGATRVIHSQIDLEKLSGPDLVVGEGDRLEFGHGGPP